MIYSGKNIGYKFIGEQVSSEIVYTPNDYLYFRAEFTWFKSGEFLKKAAPVKDIVFLGDSMQVKF